MTGDLQRYWPRGHTHLLMKAAFHSDRQVADQAWRLWLATCDFDRSFFSDLRIASRAHRRFGEPRVAGVLEPRLLGLRRYLWSAGKMRIDAAKPLLKEFSENNVKFMPIKGSVLLARDPKAMGERFISDIDVLADRESWEKAVDVAFKHGWSSAWQLSRDAAVHRMQYTHHALELTRGKHGAIDLHQFCLLLNRQRGADVMLWKRAIPGSLGGIPVLLPHPSDQLAIVFGHCFLFSNPRPPDWVADALSTISTPGFDWSLFADIVLDRELSVPAATGLTYLSKELQLAIPTAVIENILARVREPFLGELAALYRSHAAESPAEFRAIYEAECIRSRHFIERIPTSPRVGERRTIAVNLPEIKVGKKIALPIPSGVGAEDRIQFHLQLEVADKWRKTHSLQLGKYALVSLRCFDNAPLELGRLLVRRKQSGQQALSGEIDGALLLGREIAELWLEVKATDAPWIRKLIELGIRILRSANKGAGDPILLHKLRSFRARTSRRAGGQSQQGESGGEGETVLRGAFEAHA